MFSGGRGEYRVRAAVRAGRRRSQRVLEQTGSAAGGDIAVTVYNAYADQIDTPRVITRQDHTIVWRWDGAEAFGATAPDQDPSALGTFAYQKRFPGQTYDAETGLNQNWNREYNADLPPSTVPA